MRFSFSFSLFLYWSGGISNIQRSVRGILRCFVQKMKSAWIPRNLFYFSLFFFGFFFLSLHAPCSTASNCSVARRSRPQYSWVVLMKGLWNTVFQELAWIDWLFDLELDPDNRYKLVNGKWYWSNGCIDCHVTKKSTHFTLLYLYYCTSL